MSRRHTTCRVQQSRCSHPSPKISNSSLCHPNAKLKRSNGYAFSCKSKQSFLSCSTLSTRSQGIDLATQIWPSLSWIAVTLTSPATLRKKSLYSHVSQSAVKTWGTFFRWIIKLRGFPGRHRLLWTYCTQGCNRWTRIFLSMFFRLLPQLFWLRAVLNRAPI